LPCITQFELGFFFLGLRQTFFDSSPIFGCAQTFFSQEKHPRPVCRLELPRLLPHFVRGLPAPSHFPPHTVYRPFPFPGAPFLSQRAQKSPFGPLNGPGFPPSTPPFSGNFLGNFPLEVTSPLQRLRFFSESLLRKYRPSRWMEDGFGYFCRRATF